MNSQAQKLIEIADHYVGYLEKKSDAMLEDFTANAGSGNYTKFGKWYDEYYNKRGFNGAAWCHDFVSYDAYAAGIGPDVIPYTASCTTGMNWFKRRGRWKKRGEEPPEPGDIIYFTHGGPKADHVGIVRAVDGERVYTIEGNTSGGSTLIANGGGVARKSYPLNYEKIQGYGHPDYVEEDSEEMIRYQKLSDIPESSDFQAIIGDLMTAGIINGDGSDATGNGDVIDLSVDMVRMFVFMYRGGLFDDELEAAGIDAGKYK